MLAEKLTEIIEEFYAQLFNDDFEVIKWYDLWEKWVLITNCFSPKPPI